MVVRLCIVCFLGGLSAVGFAKTFQYPIYSGAADKICQGQNFYNLQGEVKEGTSDCSKGDADLVPQNIEAGVEISGVVGTLEGYGECDGDGQVGCIATAAYKAGDMSIVTAGNIKAGVRSFWDDSWSSAQGIDQYWAGVNSSGGVLRRGGARHNPTQAGLFAANLFDAPSISASHLGFRCTGSRP